MMTLKELATEMGLTYGTVRWLDGDYLAQFGKKVTKSNKKVTALL